MTSLEVIRKSVVLLCVVSAVVYAWTYFSVSEHNRRVAATVRIEVSPKIRRKIILSWTGFFRYPNFVIPSLQKLRCEVKNCDVTNNRALLNESDAVIFHWPDVNMTDIPEKLIGQRWFMFSFESPVHLPSRRGAVEKLGYSIDDTITYRQDSDIVSSYGRYRPRSRRDGPPPKLPSPKQFAERSKIAWMVSHCRTHGKRETVAKQLRNLVKVDVYGKCGGKRLMLKWNRDKAYKYLASRYLFYLAFENALCKDYVTEKTFMPLHYGMIPIVYGGAKYAKHLPPNSYIDLLDFPTLQKLAEHLTAAGTNYTLYSSYIDWRKKFVISKRKNDNSFFCDVCKKLNTASVPKRRRLGWFRRWWYNSNECINVHRANVQNLNLLRNTKNRWYMY